ncbi:MAG: hypothetical protein O7D34_02110 [Ignavibacteria bacterium]|nr:hypothetical protein [Ignavibacteria bacterium]
MSTRIKIHPRDVGLAFLNQLGAAQTEPSKPKRRTEFKRMVRSLQSLRLVPADFVWEYLTLGVDKNGDGIILAEGTNRKPRPATKKA